MRAFDAVVFDYDGTLFDSRLAISHCIRAALAARARPIPGHHRVADAVATALPLPDTLILLDPALGSDRGMLEDLVTTYRDIYLQQGPPLLKPFPGVAAALRELHAGGAKCLVVSNKGIAAIRRSIDESGLAEFIDVIFGDEPGLPKKPDPAILTDHIVPRYANLHGDRMLIVGDAETDIRFAKRAGIRCCWVSYGFGDAGRCRMLEPDYEISRIDELPAIVLPERSAISAC